MFTFNLNGPITHDSKTLGFFTFFSLVSFLSTRFLFFSLEGGFFGAELFERVRGGMVNVTVRGRSCALLKFYIPTIVLRMFRDRDSWNLSQFRRTMVFGCSPALSINYRLRHINDVGGLSDDSTTSHELHCRNKFISRKPVVYFAAAPYLFSAIS